MCDARAIQRVFLLCVGFLVLWALCSLLAQIQTTFSSDCVLCDPRFWAHTPTFERAGFSFAQIVMGGSQSRILQGLIQGGADVLARPEFFNDENVSHVLSICNVSVQKGDYGLADVLHINEADMPSTDLSQHFQRMLTFIHEARVSGGVVYVHCAAGISRSSTAVLAYLMATQNIGFGEALKFLRIRREVICPNPGFCKQLQQYQTALQHNGLRERLCHMHPNSESFMKSDRQEILEAVTMAKSTASNVGPEPSPQLRLRLSQLSDTKKKFIRERGLDLGLSWLPGGKGATAAATDDVDNKQDPQSADGRGRAEAEVLVASEATKEG